MVGHDNFCFATQMKIFISVIKYMFNKINDIILQFIVLETIRRYGSYSSSGYVRRTFPQQQLALFSLSPLYECRVYSVPNAAGRLVEYATRQGSGLQLDSGRSLDHVFRDYSRPFTVSVSMMR